MNAVDGAVGWHESIATQFAQGYDRSPAFRERALLWQSLIDDAVKPGDRVLDAGCGSGIFSFMAAQRAGSVLGIDGSANMIALCKEGQARQGLANVEFRQAMLDEMADWPAAGFDVLLSSSVLEYVDDLDNVLALLCRQLKPGGRLVISMPNARSVYRQLERLAFSVSGRPRYYAHVRNVISADAFGRMVEERGLTVTDVRYFAQPPAPIGSLMGWLPSQRSKTLFVVTAVKA